MNPQEINLARKIENLCEDATTAEDLRLALETMFQASNDAFEREMLDKMLEHLTNYEALDDIYIDMASDFMDMNPGPWLMRELEHYVYVKVCY